MTQTKQSSGRKCSICTHEKVKTINTLINGGRSFRNSSQQFGMDIASISRHTQNHLNLEIQALIKQEKIDNAIDHYREITEQLNFAKELRIAAREYLSDELGKLTLIPRSGEIDVIYEDLEDLTPQGAPKKKTETLAILLEQVDGNVIKTITKHVDIRQFALNAINTVDTVLDKVAKVEGLYQKERENNVFEKLIAIARQNALDNETSLEEELRWIVKHRDPRTVPNEVIREIETKYLS